MSAKITASADGLKVTIGNAAEDALEINQTAKSIKGINGYYLLPTVPVARVVNSSQVITSGGSSRLVTFGEEFLDNTNSMTLSRFTAPVDGIYQVDASIRYVGSIGVTLSERAISIKKNGSIILASGTISISEGIAQPAVSAIIDLYAGQYIEVFAYQSSGESLALSGNTTGNSFSVSLVSRLG